MSETAPTTLIENKQVMLCLPFYKTTNPRTLFALMSLYDKRRMAVSLDFGDAAIWHSRNKLADQFLRSKLEWSIWCDDDNLPPFGNAALYDTFTGFNLPEQFSGAHGIDRLLSHGKTLVGGLYRGRWPHGRPVFAEGIQLEKWIEEKPRDELRPSQWVGYGWVLCHRSVFLDIEKRFPNLARGEDGNGGQWFTPSEHDLKKAVEEILSDGGGLTADEIREKLRKVSHLSGRVSNLGVGEDVMFCRRAAQAGHQTFIDLGCVVGHLGEYMYGYGTKKKVL